MVCEACATVTYAQGSSMRPFPDEGYRRIPKVTAPITFRISSPEGSQLSGSSYFQVPITFGQLKYVSNPFQETH